MQCGAPVKTHVKSLHHASSYSVVSPDQGWKLIPERTGDDKDKTFNFRLKKLVGSVKSAMQKIVTLSAIKAEMVTGVQYLYDMLHIKGRGRG
eukprot:15288023-Ditylum_brightwellii.AAC.1